MSSKRQQIVDAIETRMKTILTTGGYATNAGQRVYVWRTTPLADTELPALCLYDTTGEVNEDGGIIGKFSHRLDLSIEAIASGSTTRSVVRNMIADVFKALGTDEYFGGLVETTSSPSHDINLEQADKLIGAGIVKFSVTYRTNQWEI
jgi:hypothetical protein